MPNPTIAENLLYTTVRIRTSLQGIDTGFGTGFFMNLAQQDDRAIPVIITNKHVVKGSDQIHVRCHKAQAGRASGDFCDFQIHIGQDGYFDHPNESVDLCAIPISLAVEHLNSIDQPLYYQHIGFDIIPSDDDWNYFDAIENVTMVGFPRGIADDVNNLPVVRRGITATSMTNRYNGKDEFMVDMACFPGSSGSPIFLYDRSGYVDRRTNKYNIGASRLNLVGILYAGPIIRNDGEVVLNTNPKIFVNGMMHLGYAIRSSALRDLDNVARVAAQAQKFF